MTRTNSNHVAHDETERPFVEGLNWRTLLLVAVAGLALWTIAAIIALAIFAPSALGATPAKGGRVQPCASVQKCRTLVAHQRAALLWQKKARHHANAVTYQSDVRAAVDLASRVSGVSFARLWTISACESTHDPHNVLGQYEGLFQLGRYHRSLPDIRGLDPFNPYVNAMHAALFIARHGEGEWQCTSSGGLRW